MLLNCNSCISKVKEEVCGKCIYNCNYLAILILNLDIGKETVDKVDEDLTVVTCNSEDVCDVELLTVRKCYIHKAFDKCIKLIHCNYIVKSINNAEYGSNEILDYNFYIVVSDEVAEVTDNCENCFERSLSNSTYKVIKDEVKYVSDCFYS